MSFPKAGTFGIVITPTITVSASPDYAAGDALGGKITLAAAARVSGGLSRLQTITILDRANQKPAGTLLFFNADPTAATITDNAAFVASTDDLKVVGAVAVAAGDYVTIDSKAFACLGNIEKYMAPASGTDLYTAFVLTSLPNLAATTDIQITFAFEYIN